MVLSFKSGSIWKTSCVNFFIQFDRIFNVFTYIDPGPIEAIAAAFAFNARLIKAFGDRLESPKTCDGELIFPVGQYSLIIVFLFGTLALIFLF